MPPARAVLTMSSITWGARTGQNFATSPLPWLNCQHPRPRGVIVTSVLPRVLSSIGTSGYEDNTPTDRTTITTPRKRTQDPPDQCLQVRIPGRGMSAYRSRKLSYRENLNGTDWR